MTSDIRIVLKSKTEQINTLWYKCIRRHYTEYFVAVWKICYGSSGAGQKDFELWKETSYKKILAIPATVMFPLECVPTLEFSVNSGE